MEALGAGTDIYDGYSDAIRKLLPSLDFLENRYEDHLRKKTEEANTYRNSLETYAQIRIRLNEDYGKELPEKQLNALKMLQRMLRLNKKDIKNIEDGFNESEPPIPESKKIPTSTRNTQIEDNPNPTKTYGRISILLLLSLLGLGLITLIAIVLMNNFYNFKSAPVSSKPNIAIALTDKNIELQKQYQRVLDLGAEGEIKNFEEAVKIIDKMLDDASLEMKQYKNPQELKDLRQDYLKRRDIVNENNAKRIISKAELFAAEGDLTEAIKRLKTIDKNTKAYNQALELISNYEKRQSAFN